MNPTTYSNVERKLAKALRNLPTHKNLPGLKRSREAYGDVRADLGLSRDGWSTFLSPEDSIDKLTKGEGMPLVAFALTHATGSGWDVCPFAGECVEGCVASAGNGGFDKVKRVRDARTRFLMLYPAEALALIVHELDKLSASNGGRFAARLNAFSDIRWERVLPAWFWKRYAAATFYDYTKHPARSRPADTLPVNYRLTYSYNERTTERELARTLDIARNVAVVISTRGGKLRGTGDYRPIPATLFDRPVVDGDKNDRRYDDPSGVVVALRRKGSLSVDSPFVVTV